MYVRAFTRRGHRSARCAPHFRVLGLFRYPLVSLAVERRFLMGVVAIWGEHAVRIVEIGASLHDRVSSPWLELSAVFAIMRCEPV